MVEVGLKGSEEVNRDLVGNKPRVGRVNHSPCARTRSAGES